MAGREPKELPASSSNLQIGDGSVYHVAYLSFATFVHPPSYCSLLFASISRSHHLPQSHPPPPRNVLHLPRFVDVGCRRSTFFFLFSAFFVGLYLQGEMLSQMQPPSSQRPFSNLGEQKKKDETKRVSWRLVMWLSAYLPGRYFYIPTRS